MKRHGNLFDKISDIDNIRLAHTLAQRGKRHYTAVKKINKDPEPYFQQIRKMLITGTFTTSKYQTERRFDGGKWRVIYKLPYFPDRIVQHAIMNVCGPIWKKSFIRDTFQSIEGRGTHDARKRIEKFLATEPKCHAIKIDIEQYYPSVDNGLMKACIRKSIKCHRTLRLLYDIIDSHNGLPIGNFTSQYFGNLFLTDFDWWVKQTIKLKGYFRYCDDIVFMHKDSKYLYGILVASSKKLTSIGLSIKEKIAFRHIQKQGLDFCGFVFFGTHTRLRSKIANNLRDKSKQANPKKLLDSLMSYWGWIKRIEAKSLWRNVVTSRILSLTDGVYTINPIRGTV
jgi:hypothetical protein